MESVRKLGQKSKSEAVVKKEGKTRVRKTKVEKKAMSQNDRSFCILLRKLLVVLKGISEACEIHMRELVVD